MNTIYLISQQDYEEAARRLEELKQLPATDKDTKEIKMLTKALLLYERRRPESGRPKAYTFINQIKPNNPDH